MLRKRETNEKFSNLAKIGKTGWFLAVGTGAIALFGLFLINTKNDAAIQNAIGSPENLPKEIPGWWYKEYFGSSLCESDECQPQADPDKDRLTNIHEYYFKSDPKKRDTNDNGLTDGEDVAQNFDPSKPGKVTFDSAESDDEIFGESLAFATDVKDVLVDLTDISNVAIPLVEDNLLNISQDNSDAAILEYMKSVDALSRLQFKGNIAESIETALKSQNPSFIEDLKYRSAYLSSELKTVKVPSEAVALHKYMIAAWDLVPALVSIPTIEDGVNINFDPFSNKWYDSAQAFSALGQKIDIELKRLSVITKQNEK